MRVKRILALSLPIIGALFAQIALEVIDALMMGQLGYRELAAGGLATSFYMVLIISAAGLMSAIGVLVARSRAIKDTLKIVCLMRAGLQLAVFLGVIGIVFTLCIPPFLLWCKQSPQIVSLSKEYLYGVVWGFPAILLYLLSREYLTAHESSLIIFIVCALALPLNFILNYAFMYGIFWIPALGIKGIAYATALVEWLGAFVFVGYIHRYEKFRLNVWLRFESSLIKEIVYLGGPIAVSMILEVLLFSMATFFVGYLGEKPLAVHQIVLQCTSMTVVFAYGLSQAATILIAKIHEESPVELVRWIAYFMVLTLIAAFMSAMLFIFFPQVLVGLYIHEEKHPELLNQGIVLLHIAALYQLFDSTQVVLNGILRGLKDVYLPMCLNFLSYILFGLGFAYYFAFYLGIGLNGIWYGLALGVSLAGILLSFRAYSVIRYQRSIVDSTLLKA